MAIIQVLCIGYLMTGVGAASWAIVRGGALTRLVAWSTRVLKTKVW
jgi:hypothetical protein